MVYQLGEEEVNFNNALKNQLTVNVSDAYFINIFYSLKKLVLEFDNDSAYSKDDVIKLINSLLEESQEVFNLFKFIVSQ